MFSRYGGPQIRRPSSSTPSFLTRILHCTNSRWYIYFFGSLFLYLWFGTTISPGYPFILRNIRWTRGWLRDHPSLAIIFPSSFTKVSERSPSSLMDAVLDFCRTNEGIQLTSTTDGTNENNAMQPWKDSGELFYDPPILRIDSLLSFTTNDKVVDTTQESSLSTTITTTTATPPLRGSSGTTSGSSTKDTTAIRHTASSSIPITFLSTPRGLRIDTQNIPMYTINCPDHQHRLDYQKQSLKDAGFTNKYNDLYVIPCETLNKVDENCILQRGLFRRSGLRRGEAGVSLAHIRAWQTAYSRALNGLAEAALDPTITDAKRWYHAIFLEDDATFLPKSAEYLQSMLDLIAEQNKPVEVFALWNGDWLWNTEQQYKVINGSDVLKKYGIKNSVGSSTAASTPSSTKYTPDQYTIWEATGNVPYVPGGVAYMLSITQIEILLKNIFPIDKPLDALLATGAAHGGHFMLSPAEPRAIDKRIPKGTPLITTGSDSSYNVS